MLHYQVWQITLIFKVEPVFHIFSLRKSNKGVMKGPERRSLYQEIHQNASSTQRSEKKNDVVQESFAYLHQNIDKLSSQPFKSHHRWDSNISN